MNTEIRGNFNCLPNEIVHQIFGYLNPRELIIASLVSHAFQENASDDIFWKWFADKAQFELCPEQEAKAQVIQQCVSFNQAFQSIFEEKQEKIDILDEYLLNIEKIKNKVSSAEEIDSAIEKAIKLKAPVRLIKELLADQSTLHEDLKLALEYQNSPEVIKLFLGNFPDVNEFGENSKCSEEVFYKHMDLVCNHYNSLEIFKLLPNKTLQNLFRKICMKADPKILPDIFQMLIDKGVEINFNQLSRLIFFKLEQKLLKILIPQCKSIPPLIIEQAIRCGYSVEMIELMLNKLSYEGDKVEVLNYLLKSAKSNQSLEIASWLIQQGANPYEGMFK